MSVLSSTFAIVERHRRAFPVPGFLSVAGDRMSDTRDSRAWDALWRVWRGRNIPCARGNPADVWREHPEPDTVSPRERAREALRRLAAWYRVRGA